MKEVLLLLYPPTVSGGIFHNQEGESVGGNKKKTPN